MNMDQPLVLAIVVVAVTVLVMFQALQEREIRQLKRTLDYIYDSIIEEISESSD